MANDPWPALTRGSSSSPWQGWASGLKAICWHRDKDVRAELTTHVFCKDSPSARRMTGKTCWLTGCPEEYGSTQ